jgi:hypothetical protein
MKYCITNGNIERGGFLYYYTGETGFFNDLFWHDTVKPLVYNSKVEAKQIIKSLKLENCKVVEENEIKLLLAEKKLRESS